MSILSEIKKDEIFKLNLLKEEFERELEYLMDGTDPEDCSDALRNDMRIVIEQIEAYTLLIGMIRRAR